MTTAPRPAAPRPNEIVKVGPVEIGNAKKLAIIAGPCQLESRVHAFEMASALKEICAKAGVGLIYKSSFDKANRTSAGAARGLGLEQALPIFADIRAELELPVLTDVHERDQCAAVAQAVDVLRQMPGSSLEVQAEVQAAADAETQQRFEGTVWTQCTSWYRQGGTGRVVSNWPGYMREYVHSVRRFDHERYVVEPQREGVVV